MRFPTRIMSHVLTAIVLTPLAATAEVRVGAAAPAFTATDSRGQTHALSQYQGKYVVLEWHNQECPYTKKHYASGNMQNLQKEWTAKGVVWFTVISSAPGMQGFMTPAQENSYLVQVHAAPTAVLMDADGSIGHLFDARTTPQMVVINPEGKIIYEGAVDDKPTAEAQDIRGANNYVSDALSAAMAGKPIATLFTRPYGCAVKYRD